jgi:hypothetical protein
MPGTQPVPPDLQEAFDRADASITGQDRNRANAEAQATASFGADYASSERWAAQILRAQLAHVLGPLGYKPPG